MGLNKAPQNSSMPTGYSSKVSLNTNLGRINSLKQFQTHRVNTGSTEKLGHQYLSISNLKDTPKGSIPQHQGFMKKKRLGHAGLIHSRSKDESNFYSNVISPLPDPKDNMDIYNQHNSGYLTQRTRQTFKKHQKAASLVQSDLHNLYTTNPNSTSMCVLVFFVWVMGLMINDKKKCIREIKRILGNRLL
jgi:hypothetical protein